MCVLYAHPPVLLGLKVVFVLHWLAAAVPAGAAGGKGAAYAAL